jgi:hypothetical protein
MVNEKTFTEDNSLRLLEENGGCAAKIFTVNQRD